LPARAADPALQQWGKETLAKIDAGFWMADRSLYALETANNGKPQRPGWVWDASIQLGALCSAARVEPQTFLPRVRAYASGLRTYRTTYHDLPGLDVNPAPKPPDRYYDDNAWISMSLLEAYQLTKDPKDLQLAHEAYDFLMSGEDPTTLGGGIYWHEDQTKSKNACSSGPAMVASLAFYRQTGEAKYLATARRLYDWTRKRLQDKDGLIFDSISVPEGGWHHQRLGQAGGEAARRLD
jgi:rhamnogalacturonyl hydrolase YesR